MSSHRRISRSRSSAIDAFWNTGWSGCCARQACGGLLVAGIVTNGGVASTVRGAHVREFEVTLLEDGCAAFSEEVHRAAVEGMRPVAG